VANVFGQFGDGERVIIVIHWIKFGRTQLDAARTRSVKLALVHGCTFAAEPVGLFGWVDTGVDTDTLAQRMLDEGYLLAPGALFHAGREPSSLMRINFATTQDAQFWEVFGRLRAEQG
jgi:DNA-binding transcriptional MocR family regulator